jgi:hypothetical protein
MTRIWKCDSCGLVMDDTPPVTVQLIVLLQDDDDEDDEPEVDMIEQQFCTLTCLATWSMSEALTHPEGTNT